MYISSMTGFARKNSSYSAGKIEYSWIWEIKSVNGKALDVKAKLPANLEGLSLLLKMPPVRYCTGAVSVPFWNCRLPGVSRISGLIKI